VSYPRTLSELHPPSHLNSLIMSLGPGILVCRRRLALLPPFSTRVSLARLALGRSAIPSRPCYRRLGLQFAVGENSPTGYGRFLPSLHSLERVPSQTRTPVTNSFHSYWVNPTSPPTSSHAVARLQLQSAHSACTLLPLYLTLPSRLPRSHPSVTLSCHIALHQRRMSTPCVRE